MAGLSILMFCPQFRPIVGGAERQAEKLAKALARKGVRVTILTPQYSVLDSQFEHDSGIKIHRFPLFDLNRRFPAIRGVGLINLLLIRYQIMKVMGRFLEDVDVVHCHIASPMTAFAARQAKLSGVPVICKLASAGPPSEIERVRKIGVGGEWIARSLIHDVNYWVATTQAVTESLNEERISAGKITNIPNGVELPPRSAYSIEAMTVRRFLYLGRISSSANRDIPTLLHGFSRVAEKNPDVELALVGDGDLFEEVKQRVADLPCVDRIQMPGQQQPDTWLKWADCFVLPSRREGLSNALLEAMSFGLPCIANDIPPNREVLDDGSGGVLVPVGDEDELYDAMWSMVTDIEHATAMGQAALRRVESRFAIDSVADRYIDLYGQLAQY